MASLEGFNAAEVEPESPRELLPAGDYSVILIECDLDKKPTGAVMWEFCLQVTEGPYQNRRVYSSQNYTKKDGTPNSIGRGHLSQLCRCVGVLTPRDTNELLHKRVIAKVGVRKDVGYDARNECKGFKQYQTPPVATTPAASNAAPAGGGNPSAWAATMGQ